MVLIFASTGNKEEKKNIDSYMHIAHLLSYNIHLYILKMHLPIKYSMSNVKHDFIYVGALMKMSVDF